MDPLSAVDMKPVVVQVDTVVNADTVQVYALALQDARAMIGAGGQEDVPDAQIMAAIEDHQMRALKVAFSGILSGAGIVSFARKEFCPIAVNGSQSFNGDVLGVRGGEQHDVAIAGRNAIACLVMFRAAAAQQSALRSQMQRNIALQLECADHELPCRDQHRSTFVIRTSINRRLNRYRIERNAIAFRAKVTDVIDTSTQAFFISRRVRLLNRRLTRAKQTRAERSSNERDRHFSKPLAPGEQHIFAVVHE